jgi:glycine betaine catabolism B
MKFETSIKEIIPRTSDVASFRFPRPAELSYKPGQYMLVTIKFAEKELLHPFSISSSPTEKDHIEFTKKFTPNEYSVVLKTLKPGDWARIDAPYGKFTFEGEYPKIALLTGGIGITPFRSIIKYCTDMGLSTDIALFYGCRKSGDIAFRDEFEGMQARNKNLRVMLTVNEPNGDWTGSVGNISAEMVKKGMPDYKERVFFACGPPGMVQAMTNLIKGMGLPETQLKLESFAGHT